MTLADMRGSWLSDAALCFADELVQRRVHRDADPRSYRHPELVSGSISPLKPAARIAIGDDGLLHKAPAYAERWTLKRVHGDEVAHGRLRLQATPLQARA